jgi:hypothetical protein
MKDTSPRVRDPHPSSLAAAVGHVVLEASQCEDTLGELVILHRDARTDPDPDWWTSGARLADAVEGLDDPDAGAMGARYRELLPQRHLVIHGLWLANSTGHHMNMMRMKSTKSSPRPPAYELGIGSERALASIASEFNLLERRAADAISRHMGLA